MEGAFRGCGFKRTKSRAKLGQNVVWPHSPLQPSSPSLRPVNPTSRVWSAVSPAVWGGGHFKKNGNGNCKMLVWMLILHVSLWFLTFLSLTHAMKMHESCVKSAGSPGVASDKAPSTTAFLGSAKPWWRWNFREHQPDVGFKTFCFCDTPKLLSEELLSNIYVISKSQAVKIDSAKIILDLLLDFIKLHLGDSGILDECQLTSARRHVIQEPNVSIADSKGWHFAVHWVPHDCLFAFGHLLLRAPHCDSGFVLEMVGLHKLTRQGAGTAQCQHITRVVKSLKVQN